MFGGDGQQSSDAGAPRGTFAAAVFSLAFAIFLNGIRLAGPLSRLRRGLWCHASTHQFDGLQNPLDVAKFCHPQLLQKSHQSRSCAFASLKADWAGWGHVKAAWESTVR